MTFQQLRLTLLTILLTVATIATSIGASFAQVSENADRLIGLDEYFVVPDDNIQTPAKIELGRRLFFDRILAFDSSISCATCHKPELAFSDGRVVSVGIDSHTGNRNTPTIINR